MSVLEVLRQAQEDYESCFNNIETLIKCGVGVGTKSRVERYKRRINFWLKDRKEEIEKTASGPDEESCSPTSEEAQDESTEERQDCC